MPDIVELETNSARMVKVKDTPEDSSGAWIGNGVPRTTFQQNGDSLASSGVSRFNHSPGSSSSSSETASSLHSQSSRCHLTHIKRSHVVSARATSTTSSSPSSHQLSQSLANTTTAHSICSESLLRGDHSSSLPRLGSLRSVNVHSDDLHSVPTTIEAVCSAGEQVDDDTGCPSTNVLQLVKNFDNYKNGAKMGEAGKLSPPRNLAVTPHGTDCVDNGVTMMGASDLKLINKSYSTSSSEIRMLGKDFHKQETSNNHERMMQLSDGDKTYRESTFKLDRMAKLEGNGLLAKKKVCSEQRRQNVRCGDMSRDTASQRTCTDASFSSDQMRARRVAMLQSNMSLTRDAGTVVASGSENRSMSVSHLAFNQHRAGHPTNTETVTSPAVQSAMEELGRIEKTTNALDVNQALIRCGNHLSSLLVSLNQPVTTPTGSTERQLSVASSSDSTTYDQLQQPMDKADMFNQMDTVMQRAWSVPAHGRQLGVSLSNTIRQAGGLDTLISSTDDDSHELKRRKARVLSNCLTTENRQYVVERGLVGRVVQTACLTCCHQLDNEDARAGAGILKSLFKHSEGTCSTVVRYGGLDAVLEQCKKRDVPTLRQCAMALANLSLYGGPENQQTMLQRRVPNWLFPLAFHSDDVIRYYACLAIATMVANKEIEAAVLRSGTLELIGPFLSKLNPAEFAQKALPVSAGGQSESWLRRLVPVLLSHREEARNLAAFHFSMEASLKVQQRASNATDNGSGNEVTGTGDSSDAGALFYKIGAIEPLIHVARLPCAVAARFARNALSYLDIETPHTLSQQVPLWSTTDVANWLHQIEFDEYMDGFMRSRVDGDLLLRLTDSMLDHDIGMSNGILRQRFMRELRRLKIIADYSSCDASQLGEFLHSVAPEITVYAYSMLMSGVDRNILRCLTDEQLQEECGVSNAIHRFKIQESIKHEILASLPTVDMEKTLDCFISYRRSNGSQLASLLKVHLELRGFSVFIDVERLEAGKFGSNLLKSIYQARNFLLVLTPDALNRCIQDEKDWVRKEINAALKSKCNIVPIMDNFQWPASGLLPEDMRPVCKFNGVRWIHDYQEACVDKLERFMRGETRSEPRIIGRGLGLHVSSANSPAVSRCHSPSIVPATSAQRSLVPLSPLPPRRWLGLSSRANGTLHPPLSMKRSRSLDGGSGAAASTSTIGGAGGAGNMCLIRRLSSASCASDSAASTPSDIVQRLCQERCERTAISDEEQATCWQLSPASTSLSSSVQTN